MKDKYYVQYQNLGLSIAYFRKKRGLTQKQLADILDINYETISRIENANTGISFDLLFALSDAIELPLSILFTHANL